MAREMTASLRLAVEAQQWVDGSKLARASYKSLVDGVVRDTERLTKAVDAAGTKLKGLSIGGAGGQASADLAQITQAAQVTQAKLDLLGRESAELRGQFSSTGTAITALASDTAGLAQQAAVADGKLDALAASAAHVSAAVATSDARIERLVSDVSKLTAAVAGVDTKLDATQVELREFAAGADRAGDATRRLRRRAEDDFAGIRRGAADMRNLLASVGLSAGIGYAAVGNQTLSAQLDKSLIQLRQTAGADASLPAELRRDFFALSRDYARPVESLQGGFNTLIQSGLSVPAARAATRAIAPASAVTGADEGVLAGALTVSANAYGFDLSAPREATRLLDQMTVAGRLGNAELENLADIFARVGVNAKGANLTFPQTLGFIETLSKIERAPERLATLSDSTLRLFTNDKYKQAAAEATGVNFYAGGTARAPSGAAREPADVLRDISTAYQKLTTDRQRDRFISGAFGDADLDTQRGLRTLLAGNTLTQWQALSRQILEADGAIARDLPTALDNAVDQANRLKTTFREVGDALAMPINKAFADLVQWELRPRKDGGLGLSAGGTAALTVAEIAGVTTAAYGLKLGATKLGGKLFGGLVGDAANLATGIAQGQLIKEAGLAAPVFVTNWPGSMTAGPAGLSDATAVITKGSGLAALTPMLVPLALTVAGGALALWAIDKIPTVRPGDAEDWTPGGSGRSGPRRLQTEPSKSWHPVARGRSGQGQPAALDEAINPSRTAQPGIDVGGSVGIDVRVSDERVTTRVSALRSDNDRVPLRVDVGNMGAP